MEDDMSNSSSSESEISPAESNMSTEAIDEDSSRSGSSRTSSQMNEIASTSGHPLHRTTKQTNLLQPCQICQVPCIYLISNILETVPNFWTNTRRFMLSRQAYICRIPKQLVTNGIIRQTLKFISRNTLRNFHMKIQLMFRGRIVDEWQFQKGLVHREVITRWETTMNRSPGAHYFDPTHTARTILKTKLYNGDQMLLVYYTFIVFT